MTQIQYDVLLSKLIHMENKLEYLQGMTNELVSVVKNLSDKTLVVTDVTEQLKQLSISIESLKDEVRA